MRQILDTKDSLNTDRVPQSHIIQEENSATSHAILLSCGPGLYSSAVIPITKGGGLKTHMPDEVCTPIEQDLIIVGCNSYLRGPKF